MRNKELKMPSFLLIPVIYLAFISLGLPDSVFGTAWPSMRPELGAPLQAAGLVTLILTSCSALSAIASGKINKRFGTGPVVLISSVLTATGLLGYSLAPSYLWILVAALPLGFGAGAVDSSLNGYVATHYSSRHMNWLHASWGIGATVGPLIMTAVLASGASWRSGYRVISGIQGALALLFLLSLGLWSRASGSSAATGGTDGEAEAAHTKSRASSRRPKISGMNHAEPWIQIAMYAVYCAAEYSVGVWTASMLVESRHHPAASVGSWVSLYYGGIMIGRVLTGIVSNRLGNRFMVRLGLGIAILGAALLCVPQVDWLALPALLLVGLGFAPIYPCLMHETPERFDADTYQTVIGYQMAAANIGGSVLPALIGLIASATSLEILGPCVLGLVALLAILGEILNRRT
jgi:Fucose permease